MYLRKFIIAVATVAAAIPSFAQYATDAFRFSSGNNSATARFNALGGPQTAIGGDLTSLYGNPAGLGMFTKSEFSFTPSYNVNKNETGFFSSKNLENSSHLNLNNIGIVFHSPVSKSDNLTSGILSFNFGIGYQKTNFFNNSINFRNGVTNQNGISDYFSEQANSEGNIPKDIIGNATYASYQGFLIDNNVDNSPTKYKPITTKDADQALTTKSMGNQSNLDFSVGLNISNKIYLGGTLGLASINYRSNNFLNEQGINFVAGDSYNYNANLLNNYDTQGSGVNFKIGAILKPIYEFRIGLSLESPTWYRITDNFSQELSLKDYKNFNINGKDNFPFDYRLSTPLKLNGGLSYFIGKRGFLTANLSYIDYANIKYKSNTSSVDVSTNSSLINQYKEAVNYSLGAEFKVVDNLMIRAGYSNFGNPYRRAKFSTENYSGGLGYKFGNYYIDGAVVIRNNDIVNEYATYSLNTGNEPLANFNTQSTNISVTFGARF